MNIIEAHILNRERTDDFYGEIISLGLVSFLRPEQKFASIEELKNQISKDKEMALEMNISSSKASESLYLARSIISRYLLSIEWKSDEIDAVTFSTKDGPATWVLLPFKHSNL